MRKMISLLACASVASVFAACSDGDIAIGIRGYFEEHGRGTTGGSTGVGGGWAGAFPGTGGGQTAGWGGSEATGGWAGAFPGTGGGLHTGGWGGSEATGGWAGAFPGTGGTQTAGWGGGVGGRSGAFPGTGGGMHTGGWGGAGTGGSGGTQGPSIPLTDGLYASGDYSGYLWTARDGGGSTISPPCDGTVCFTDTACVSGLVAKVPLVDGSYDYANTWGVMIGWTLAPSPTGELIPVSVEGKTSIVVGLSNASGQIPRVILSVVDSSGQEQQYCKSLALVNGTATVALTSLKTECWGTTGVAFDPATMRPTRLEIQLVSDTSRERPFDNLCISQLEID